MERTCSMPDCEKPHKGRGFCEMHLLRWRKYGDPTVVRKKQPKPSEQRPRCSIEGCDEVAAGRGWCRNHYMRHYRRGGDPAVMLPRGNFSTPVSTRLRMFKKQSDGCWLWVAFKNPKGYGLVGSKGSVVLAHRAIYKELVGPIDGDLTLDHLCGVRACVNPEHLDPCTRRENYFRGGVPHFELRGKAAYY
jgi:hypothetical protein